MAAHRPQVECVCRTCQVPFKTYASRVDRGRGEFCSRACLSLGRKRRSIEERFWPKVNKTETCWLWTGATDEKGYGKLNRGEQAFGQAGGPIAMAHRVAWELTYGPIPDGLNALHKCDTPPCVRPDHLFLGTLAENNDDMWTKGRARPQGRVPKSYRGQPLEA